MTTLTPTAIQTSTYGGSLIEGVTISGSGSGFRSSSKVQTVSPSRLFRQKSTTNTTCAVLWFPAVSRARTVIACWPASKVPAENSMSLTSDVASPLMSVIPSALAQGDVLVDPVKPP